MKEFEAEDDPQTQIEGAEDGDGGDGERGGTRAILAQRAILWTSGV
jgi:hypothetical protein